MYCNPSNTWPLQRIKKHLLGVIPRKAGKEVKVEWGLHNPRWTNAFRDQQTVETKEIASEVGSLGTPSKTE